MYHVHSIKLSNEHDTLLAEKVVLNCLEKYKEQMNRDRFILPADKDISFFKSAFDNALKCFSY